MKKTLLTLNYPNLNGRTYTTNVVENAILKFKDKESYLLSLEDPTLYTPDIDVEKIIGIIKNLEVVEDVLVGDVQIIDRCPEYIRDSLINDKLYIRPFGLGTLDEHSIIHDYNLVAFSVTNDPA